MCFRCLEWHRDALKMIRGAVGFCCQECGITPARLAETGQTPALYLHPKDWIYAFLCRTCSDAYEQKRKDLYGATLYGRLKKIS